MEGNDGTGFCVRDLLLIRADEFDVAFDVAVFVFVCFHFGALTPEDKRIEDQLRAI